MKELVTEVIINAPRRAVWDVLIDFDRYSDWNPFIVASEGRAVVGSRLVNRMKQGNRTFTFRPNVTQAKEAAYLEWLGHLFIPGLLDGRHYFRLQEAAPEVTKLIHGERFGGVLSGLILNRIADDTRDGYIAMNRALRERVEG